MEVSDEALLRQFIAGDVSAFSRLVERHRSRTYAICWRILRNDADAEDATQEAFLALYRNASSFRGGAKFSTWMYRVTTNTCRDLHRKRARRPQSSDVEVDTLGSVDGLYDDGRIRDMIARADLEIDMRRALARLQPQHREVLVMHVFLGLPYLEIAERTGVAVGTVKSRIHRATAALDAEWRTNEDESHAVQGTTQRRDPSNDPTEQL